MSRLAVWQYGDAGEIEVVREVERTESIALLGDDGDTLLVVAVSPEGGIRISSRDDAVVVLPVVSNVVVVKAVPYTEVG